MPTTMLLRLVVVPLRLLIVAEPLVVLPPRLKIIDCRVLFPVGLTESVTVNGRNEATVVAGDA
jgi:hypothetical protein